MFRSAINTVQVRVNEKASASGLGNPIPSAASDICSYYSYSCSLYEYTIEPDDLFQHAKERGWILIPIPVDEPIYGQMTMGVEIRCFRYDEYKKGQDITKDLFFEKRITNGYYMEEQRTIIVYDSDTQRFYLESWRR